MRLWFMHYIALAVDTLSNRAVIPTCKALWFAYMLPDINRQHFYYPFTWRSLRSDLHDSVFVTIVVRCPYYIGLCKDNPFQMAIRRWSNLQQHLVKFFLVFCKGFPSSMWPCLVFLPLILLIKLLSTFLLSRPALDTGYFAVLILHIIG